MRINLIKIIAYCCICISATSVSLPVKASSDPYDGKKLLETCRALIKALDRYEDLSTYEMAKGDMCMGYMIAINDAEGFYNELFKLTGCGDLNKLQLYCIPGSVTLDQEVRLLVKYLEQHPKQLFMPSIFLITAAFGSYFPCEKK